MNIKLRVLKHSNGEKLDYFFFLKTEPVGSFTQHRDVGRLADSRLINQPYNCRPSLKEKITKHLNHTLIKYRK